MAAQREGRANGKRHVGGLYQPATAQRFRSTLEYMEIFPHNLPNSPVRNVSLISYWGGLCGNFSA
jgi:hypothetical protein